MTTRITNATTYGLDSYSADLKHLAPLSDEERRTLLACLPTTPSATASDSWKRGSLVGWCMAWHAQPFLDEEADEEAQTLAAPVSRKRRKGTHASACVSRTTGSGDWVCAPGVGSNASGCACLRKRKPMMWRAGKSTTSFPLNKNKGKRSSIREDVSCYSVRRSKLK